MFSPFRQTPCCHSTAVIAVMAVVVTGVMVVSVATIFVGVTVITALRAAAVGEFTKERTKFPR
jgi:hypothetical protein